VNDETKVQIPASAISAAGDDIAVPGKALLISLRLMGTDEDQEKAGQAGALFTGPPQSVAVIEAGATALTKWWAAGLGVAATAFWGLVKTFWTGQPPETHRTMLLAGAIVSAAVILAISFIIGFDVRGRASASVATIHARETIGRTALLLAEAAHGVGVAETATQIVALPGGTRVKYLAKPSREETGWTALAVQTDSVGTTMKFLVVKGAEQAWATPAELHFDSPAT